MLAIHDVTIICTSHVFFLQCNAGVAAFKMFQSLSKPPVKMMLMGGGCSTESEATAQTCHLFNVTQVIFNDNFLFCVFPLLFIVSAICDLVHYLVHGPFKLLTTSDYFLNMSDARETLIAIVRHQSYFRIGYQLTKNKIMSPHPALGHT